MPDERTPDDVEDDLFGPEQDEAQHSKAAPGGSGPPESDPKGSEVDADRQRAGGGPRYHGGGWEKADEEAEAESLTEHLSTSREESDERIDERGARGAVFGRGGQGLARHPEAQRERDDTEVEDERKPERNPGQRRGS